MKCPTCGKDVVGRMNSRDQLRCESCHGLLTTEPMPGVNPSAAATPPTSIEATPDARKLAAEYGIDLATVPTAPGQVISVADVEKLVPKG